MNFSNITSKQNVLSFIYILFLLVLGRLIPHPPNFTPILAAAIIAPYMMDNKWISLSIPLLAMIITDFFIGFHSSILWVYGAIAISTLLSDYIRRFNKYYLQLGAMALISSILFFLITNFSVWLIWDFYPKSFEGLILCYIAGIPFFKNTLMSTILYTGLFVVIMDTTKNSIFGISLKKIFIHK